VNKSVEVQGFIQGFNAASDASLDRASLPSNNEPAGIPRDKIHAPGSVARMIRGFLLCVFANRQQQPFTYGSPPGREDFYFVAGK